MEVESIKNYIENKINTVFKKSGVLQIGRMESTKENLQILNEGCARIVKMMVEKGDISIYKDHQIIYIDSPYLCLENLSFLPFIYPEMDKNTYTLKCHGQTMGEISYDGLPEQDFKHGCVKLGTEMTFSPEFDPRRIQIDGTIYFDEGGAE